MSKLAPEYRRALMDVAEIVSSARQAAIMHSDERTKFIDGKLRAYDIVLERLVGLMGQPMPPSLPSPLTARKRGEAPKD